MKEFLLLFRADLGEIGEASPAEVEGWNQQWMDWIGGIAAQNKLAEGGNHLAADGRVVRSRGVVTDGPYTETKESVLGYIIIKVKSYEEAVTIAKACPLLNGEGNSVEVREIGSPPL